ncbi:MAG: DNA-3-methyladenine glycosylase [Oscillospiraceae bacterium]|nr:DNA-3-methyladenine glycosylase [Oscillospiraceae bacterium]
MKVTKLAEEFYLQDTLTVARDLIGCYLVRRDKNGTVVGRITETEAYIGAVDKACHAYPNKLTPRTAPLFAAGGIAYVYLVYGMYHCLNVVTEREGAPCAVLIRGADVVYGEELAARSRYGRDLRELSARQLQNMSNGPGKLCRALAVDLGFNRESLLGGRLFIADSYNGSNKYVRQITAGKRIGIDYAEEARDFLWRFHEQ